MYYWHKETNRTRWKFPEEEGEQLLLVICDSETLGTQPSFPYSHKANVNLGGLFILGFKYKVHAFLYYLFKCARGV